MDDHASANSITVVVRVRPFTPRETAQLVRTDDNPIFYGDGSLAHSAVPRLTQRGLRSVIKVVDDRCLVFDPPEDSPLQKFSRSIVPQGKRVKDQTFCFDRVFGAETSQQDVYEATTRTLLDSVMDGYNATVFAYGATGCGKTHTITGTAEMPGIIFLAMQELFERIDEAQGDKVTEISLSYLEIYNETIRDLLVVGGSKQGLSLREDANQSVSVAGLSSHRPRNVQEVMDMIVRGNEYRTMSPTEANATSSRSHAVLQINVSQKDRNADINEPHTMATLSIIDLAGSERASATKNRGDRLLEGANINKSLLALGSCINALCDVRRKQHVPYRNSKLTRLLKFSLGGNCKTVMIVCVSPSSAHFDETQNTLRYANRAKNIQTKVSRNVYNVNRHVKDFLKKINEQMRMIEELKGNLRDHESVAFSKFEKLVNKREAVLREGIERLQAVGHEEREERGSLVGKVHLVDKKVSLLSAWLEVVNGMDSVPRVLEEEVPQVMQQLSELSSTKSHLQRRLEEAESGWDRCVDSAHSTGERQLRDAGGERELDGLSRASNLVRAEAEVRKREKEANCANEGLSWCVEMIKDLVRAHVESISDIEKAGKGADDAERALKGIKERSMAVVQRAVDSGNRRSMGRVSLGRKSVGGRNSLSFSNFAPPSTPKLSPRKRVPEGLSPARLALGRMEPLSPVKASPRRWKAKKPIMSPKKKKLGVRWKDEDEDGRLADYDWVDEDEGGSGEKQTEAKREELPAVVVTSDERNSESSASSSSTSAFSHTSLSTSSSTPSLSALPSKPRFNAGFLKRDSLSFPMSQSFANSPRPSALPRASSPGNGVIGGVNGSPSAIPVHVRSLQRSASSDSDRSRGSLSGLGLPTSSSTPSQTLQPSLRARRVVSAAQPQTAAPAEIPADAMRDLEKVLRRTSLHDSLRKKWRRRSSGSPNSLAPVGKAGEGAQGTTNKATSGGGPAAPTLATGSFSLQNLRRVNKAAETEWKTTSVLSPRPGIVKQGGRRRQSVIGTFSGDEKERSGPARYPINSGIGLGMRSQIGNTGSLGSSSGRASLGMKALWR